MIIHFDATSGDESECPDESDRRKLTSADLGVGVSVCIAALSRRVKRIVCITDRKGASVEFSNEDIGVQKKTTITRHWVAMSAGSDVSPIPPIVRHVRQILADKTGSNGKFIETKIPLDLVTGAFERAYQEYLSHLATSLVLGRWQLTMQEFLDTGRKRFGADDFDAMWAQIQEVRLRCQLLVAGFDDQDEPHIFLVKNPGVIESKDNIGYFAIGNGDFAAMSMLGFLKHNHLKSVEETYCNAWHGKIHGRRRKRRREKIYLYRLKPRGELH